ncbi:lytic transglycosylase domain-containing protein [Methyloversatilis thermotolerans]|uniref:lytic transglycosylase domain-containing protein n=1 Tax=Methyloversatilis thermotolerans TaxID=1346290 RepID=UPI00035C487F|nr:lytic transglycosylase domain-containing protein [Methyloversatilis thermotolerans]
MTRPLAALLCLFAHCAWADVYVKEDADGTVVLTDAPADTGFELLLRSPREGHSSPAPAASVSGATHPAARLHATRIERAALASGVDAGLLHAVIRAESAYNPNALSPKGAAGLMQLMPATARRYGVTDRFDPDQNVLGGALYLRDLLARFNGELELALAAYNAGEGAVQKYGNQIPPYDETRRYVPRVLHNYRSLQ